MANEGMSSPVMANPVMSPLPPLPPRRRRSFAGPFVLIVLGVVFLMCTMRVLSLGRMAHIFANYWPLLLILWGVIKLVEHQQARRGGARASGIGAERILLELKIVVIRLVDTLVVHFHCY